MLDQLVLRRLGAVEPGGGPGHRRRRRGAARRPTRPCAPRSAGVHARRRGCSRRPQSSVTQLALRADTGPLRDVRVRQALAQARSTATRCAPPSPPTPCPPTRSAWPPPSPATRRPPRRRSRPTRPGAAQLLTAAGWKRDVVTGRWDTADGRPARIVVGAGADRPDDVRVAAGRGHPAPRRGHGRAGHRPVRDRPVRPADRGAHPAEHGPVAPPRRRRPPPPRRPPRRAWRRTSSWARGPSAATWAPSWPAPTAARPPPRSTRTRRGRPTGFCFPALQPLFNELMSSAPRADSEAVVERILWQQMPALPLFQPVSLVVSTAEADAATSIGPGSLLGGPLAGAPRWRQPPTDPPSPFGHDRGPGCAGDIAGFYGSQGRRAVLDRAARRRPGGRPTWTVLMRRSR